MQYVRRVLIWLRVLKKPEPPKQVNYLTGAKLREIARMCDTAAKRYRFAQIGLTQTDLYYEVVTTLMQQKPSNPPEGRELALFVYSTAKRLERAIVRHLNSLALWA